MLNHALISWQNLIISITCSLFGNKKYFFLSQTCLKDEATKIFTIIFDLIMFGVDFGKAEILSVVSLDVTTSHVTALPSLFSLFLVSTTSLTLILSRSVFVPSKLSAVTLSPLAVA